ncbi:hypothetical protein RHCRD62_10339 [Rhodococcus sp. RD6.2]|nr:hypothetical protein RHCRD62_10339 [Rhodococcus sp. RD6.2]
MTPPAAVMTFWRSAAVFRSSAVEPIVRSPVFVGDGDACLSDRNIRTTSERLHNYAYQYMRKASVEGLNESYGYLNYGAVPDF